MVVGFHNKTSQYLDKAFFLRYVLVLLLGTYVDFIYM